MSHKSSVKGGGRKTTTTAAVGYKGGESNNNRGARAGHCIFRKGGWLRDGQNNNIKSGRGRGRMKN